ncbi:ABC transporter substrate-binding protein [Paenibacillus sp. ACRRY]|uniref:ABC transporter substrate-binding protein n=1 Tax=Paenibacillus sp. ACRRY TaxID=2918208 RepID=UPI001EF72055|nr:ABC transporter substrate-binding protein [Paenibacillus sp. ACRRY]MCG7381505.1 ABC transporter substrate-binding protein [Paenibacillus sp. ACRRY]
MRTFKKIAILSTMTLLLTALLSACGSHAKSVNGTDAMASGGQEDTKVDTIMVSEVYHNLLYLPLYVANNQGFLEQNHIELSSIRAAGSGPTALSSVISGESAFSFHGPEHVAFANAKGGDARSLVLLSGSAPVWAVAREGVTVSSPEEFKGKTIVVGLAPTSSNSLMRKLFEDNNIDIDKDVTITEVQNGSELGAVLAGKADIAFVYEPQLDQGIAEGLHIVHDFTKDYPDFAFATMNTTTSFIKKNPDLTQRFVTSIEQALDYIHSNPEGAKAVAVKEFPNLDKKVVDQAVQRMIDSKVYPADGHINESAFEAAIGMQRFIGNLKEDLAYEDIIDASFTK